MAKMYPEVFPGTWSPENPEFTVYQTLRKLPDNYHVLYSRRISGSTFGKAECEIDFVVFNGSDVLVCIEVKGGNISYDGPRSAWTQNGKPMRDVVRQATESSHALARALLGETEGLCIDWALCFPDCCLTAGPLPLEVNRGKVIDQADILDANTALGRLEKLVRTKYGRRPGLTASQVRTLIAKLTRSIGFVQVLGVRLAHDEKQIVQVTDEQLEVLTDIEANSRILVQGGAGTGKTLIAQSFAKNLAEREKTVLLLFFNRGITSMVRYAFERGGKVQVSTFSSLAKRLVEKEFPEWWEAQVHKGDDFWDTVLPLKLLDIPQHALPKFDAIIVDEGQDFKPGWFEFLALLLRDPKSSHFVVLLDSNQDIFNHWEHFPCSPPPARKLLKKNCRNTRAIIDYLNHCVPTGMTYFHGSPMGVPIREKTTHNPVDELEKVTRDIEDLVGKNRVSPGKIVILIDSEKDQSFLRDVNSIGGIPLKSTYGRYEPEAANLYYSTIEIFKGLEAEVVLLVISNPGKEPGDKRSLYVSASRARLLLNVYHRVEKENLKQNRD